MEDSGLKSVAGLVDSARAAEFLGVSQSQIRVWMLRKVEAQKVAAESGEEVRRNLPALFPDPISLDDQGCPEAELNRGRVWRRADIESFAKLLAGYKPKGGRTPARLVE